MEINAHHSLQHCLRSSVCLQLRHLFPATPTHYDTLIRQWRFVLSLMDQNIHDPTGLHLSNFLHKLF